MRKTVKKNYLTVLIIFSLMLNLFFIGTALYHKTRGFLATKQHPSGHHLLYEKLHLSAAQLARFAPLRDRFHAFLAKQGQVIKKKRLELIALLAEGRPDQKAIHKKAGEIHHLHQQMQSEVIKHLLQESALMTPAQRKQFFTLITRRLQSSRDPRPGWMPKAERKGK